MVNPQRPDDHEHFVSPEPDVEGHAATEPTADSEDEDTEGHGFFQPPNDGEDDTEAHAEF